MFVIRRYKTRVEEPTEAQALMKHSWRNCLSPLMRTHENSLWFRLESPSSKTTVSKKKHSSKEKKRKKTSAHMAVCVSPIQPALVWIKVRQINRLIFKCCPNSQGQSKVQLITPLVAGTSAPWVFDFPGRCWTPAAVTRHFVRFVDKCFPLAARAPFCAFFPFLPLPLQVKHSFLFSFFANW